MLRVGSTLISEAALEKVLSLIHLVVENGFSNRLLLSQDAELYNVGERKRSNARPYSYLVGISSPYAERRIWPRFSG